jgi:ribosomal protein L24
VDQHSLKLGDDVIVTSGPHAGREGYVIGITSHDGEATPDSVAVRLLGSPRLDVSLKSNDLQKHEKVP